MTLSREQLSIASVEVVDPATDAPVNLRSASDEELARLLQADRKDALVELMRRFKEPLMSYIYRYIGSMNVAQDVLQEVFIRMYQKRDTYKSCARFSTWLFTIAGNYCRSELRRPWTRYSRPLTWKPDAGDEEYLPFVDGEPTPDRVADNAFKYRYIQKALVQLPPIFREAVILCDVQEFSYEEIAEITGVSEGTVKSRIFRGRTMLRDLLKDIYD